MCSAQHCFAVHLHVAKDVTTDDWIASQLAVANKHFAPLDVGFEVVSTDAESPPHIANREERDALVKNPAILRNAIHVFVTGQLDNLDAEGEIFGVTWRLPKQTRKFIVLSAKAWDKTLAHELGHFFSLQHSTYDISIMNKTERKAPPIDERTFAPEELEQMRAVVKRYLRELKLARHDSA